MVDEIAYLCRGITVFERWVRLVNPEGVGAIMPISAVWAIRDKIITSQHDLKDGPIIFNYDNQIVRLYQFRITPDTVTVGIISGVARYDQVEVPLILFIKAFVLLRRLETDRHAMLRILRYIGRAYRRWIGEENE